MSFSVSRSLNWLARGGFLLREVRGYAICQLGDEIGPRGGVNALEDLADDCRDDHALVGGAVEVTAAVGVIGVADAAEAEACSPLRVWVPAGRSMPEYSMSETATGSVTSTPPSVSTIEVNCSKLSSA